MKCCALAQIYAGPLADGARAAILLNRETSGTQYPYAPITGKRRPCCAVRQAAKCPPSMLYVCSSCFALLVYWPAATRSSSRSLTLAPAALLPTSLQCTGSRLG